LYNPNNRISALEIMLHPFFDELRDKKTKFNDFDFKELFDFDDDEELPNIDDKNLISKYKNI
jgi:serine/threonine protein kinase